MKAAMRIVPDEATSWGIDHVADFDTAREMLWNIGIQVDEGFLRWTRLSARKRMQELLHE